MGTTLPPEIMCLLTEFHKCYAIGFLFYAWGLPPGEHYSKRPNHGQECSWRAEVQSKKKYIQLCYVLCASMYNIYATVISPSQKYNLTEF